MSFRKTMLPFYGSLILVLINVTQGKIFSIYGWNNMTASNEIRPQEEYSVYQKMMMNLNNALCEYPKK